MGVFDVDEIIGKLPKIQTYRGWTVQVKGRYVHAKPPASHRGQWPFGFGITRITQPIGKEGALGITARIDRLIKGLETPKFAPTLAKGERVPAGYERDLAGRKAPRYPYPKRSTRTRRPAGTVRSRVRSVVLTRQTSSATRRTEWRKR